jgi:hypothetical protein
MQAHDRHSFARESLGSFAQLAEDADVDARLHAVLQQLDHLAVAHLHVIDEQLFFRALDEARQPGPRVLGADEKVVVVRV